jgi:hypothetical protein
VLHRFSGILISALISVLPVEHSFALEPNLCSVRTISEGSLSNSAAGQVKRLSSLAVDGGNSSEIEVTCSAPAKLVISAVQIDGDRLDSASLKAIATSHSTGVSAKSGEGLDLAAGTTKLSIDLIVDKSSPLHPGKYRFNVNLIFS